MEIPAGFNQVILETPRLFLKEMSPEINRYLFTSCSNKDVRSYMGLTEAEFEVEKYKSEKGMITYQSSFKTFVLVDRSDGRVLGRAGFHNWYFNHSRSEMGYMLLNDTDKQKGYMTEALKTIIKFGYEEMGLNRIEALIGPGNLASLTLVRKLGFTEEGTLREHYYRYPSIEDSVCFSLLKKEYDRIKDKW
jgi:ribosomal-protein-alanine N-acetyltransferase